MSHNQFNDPLAMVDLQTTFALRTRYTCFLVSVSKCENVDTASTDSVCSQAYSFHI